MGNSAIKDMSTVSKEPVEQIRVRVDNSKELLEFPLRKGTEYPHAIDVTNLYKKTGLFTYDPGFIATASCESKITYIDGDNGILRHRGYSIEELAEKSDFMEVCYLLINSELPNHEQKEQFIHNVKYHTMVHEQLQFLYRGFPRKAHPMAILVGAVASLSAFYHEETDIMSKVNRLEFCHKIIAKMPTLAAMAYKYSIGQPFNYPDNSLSFSENFLHMMFSVPGEKYQNKKAISNAIDKIFILHADHEQNASTSTVRLAGSSGANPYACVGAGIASLWGPSHGGANEAVIKMLTEIGTKDRIPEFIKRAKDKDDPFKLMGFGHRVYKHYDPRAKVLKNNCKEVLDELGIKHDPLLEIAVELEKIALADEYFIERKLFPNVDFYSGIIYKAIGIPVNLFTAMFAIARTAGWVSQWNEMIEDKHHKIGRPRQIYTGYNHREFIPINKRK